MNYCSAHSSYMHSSGRTVLVSPPYDHLTNVGVTFVWQSSLAGKPSLATIFPGVTEKTGGKFKRLKVCQCWLMTYTTVIVKHVYTGGPPLSYNLVQPPYNHPNLCNTFVKRKAKNVIVYITSRLFQHYCLLGYRRQVT